MKRAFLCFMLSLLLGSLCLAQQSTITESEGYACMGEDRTKRQTEEIALQDAKKKAIEQVSTYIQAETQIEDFELKKDLINAYANAKVKIIYQQGKWDSEPPKVGDCYRVSIRAEVVPDEYAMKKIGEVKNLDDPSLPLKVKLWTEKRVFEKGEKIKIFFKGNKPFFAKILYKQSDGNVIQILPNPYRLDNYFQGGVVYEIPSGPDRFELEVTPPFGEENIIIYASTSPLGSFDLENVNNVFLVKSKDFSEKTRGILIRKKDDNKPSAGEFFEEVLRITTK